MLQLITEKLHVDLSKENKQLSSVSTEVGLSRGHANVILLVSGKDLSTS